MAASTYLGQVPPDDPMFLGGPQLFSRHESNGSTKNTVPNTTGETQANSTSTKKKSYNPLADLPLD